MEPDKTLTSIFKVPADGKKLADVITTHRTTSRVLCQHVS